jgi:TatD DNase family protein
VRQLLVPAVEASGWQRLLDLCTAHAGLYPALGMHPVFIERHKESHIELLANEVARQKPVAIGEIGLDYFIEQADRQAQIRLFEAQLDIAAAAGLPVILHVRKAHDDVLKALRKHPVKGGIAHAFNGSLQQAHKYLDAGFKLGFGGMLTYQRSRKIRALAEALPAEAIVLETDAPDMTVASHHGERNSPEYLPECLAALAEVRGDAVETLAAQTSANARAVLGLESIE